MRALLFSLVLVIACSHRDVPSASRAPAAAAGGAVQITGDKMQDVDDLDTNNVQGIARKYRGQGLVVVDRMVAAMRADGRPRVRANAVTVLLDLFYFREEKDKARPYLMEALGDSSPDVRSRAADGLAGFFFDDPAVKTALTTHAEALRKATSSPDPVIQLHAISALQKMGERPPAESMLRAANAGLRREGIAQALEAHDLTAVPALIDLARRDSETVVRMESIPVVAELATPDARDALLGDLVGDPSDGVANAAIKAAGSARAAALAGKLEAILALPEGNRTAAALVALGAFRDTAAIPAIAAHLEDQSSDSKWNAKVALDALVGSPRALPDWQVWAREKGYLLKSAKPPP